MAECPICDAELKYDLADYCEECGARFCVHCQLTVARAACDAVCIEPRCAYSSKIICDDCLIVERVNPLVHVGLGTLIGIAAAATLFWFDQNDFTYQTALIAVLILLGCIGGAFLFGKHKICKCPQCKQEIKGHTM